MKRLSRLTIALLFIVFAPPVIAQSVGYRVYTISPFDFVAVSADSPITYPVDAGVPLEWHVTWQNPGTLVAPIHLPDGAVIEFMELDYCRKIPAGTTEAEGWLEQVCDDDPRAGCSGSDIPPKVRPELEGCHLSLTPHGMRVDNQHHTLMFVLNLENGGNVAYGPIKLYYRMEAPPAPDVATFSDVPTTHPFFRFVEALYNTGAVAGCGDGKYCPNSPVTRGQLAVFLATAMGLGW